MSEDEKKMMMALLILPDFSTDGLSKAFVDSHLKAVGDFSVRFDTEKLLEDKVMTLISLLNSKENTMLVRVLALNSLIGEGVVVPERADKIRKITEDNPFDK